MSENKTCEKQEKNNIKILLQQNVVIRRCRKKNGVDQDDGKMNFEEEDSSEPETLDHLLVGLQGAEPAFSLPEAVEMQQR